MQAGLSGSKQSDLRRIWVPPRSNSSISFRYLSILALGQLPIALKLFVCWKEKNKPCSRQYSTGLVVFLPSVLFRNGNYEVLKSPTPSPRSCRFHMQYKRNTNTDKIGV